MSDFDRSLTLANAVPEPPFDSTNGGRNADGTFTRTNTAAMKHGVFSRQVREARLPEQAAILASLEAERAAIENDLGGPESLSVIARDLIVRYQELSLVADHLGRKLV